MSKGVEQVDVVVIGAGVVGLAIARRLALAGREVIILERHDAIGTEVSARNSEVIHAGLYYPTGSLRAQLCVQGKEQLYQYLAQRNLPHQNCGKIVVAVDDEQKKELEKYRQQAAINQAGDLIPLSAADIKALEPDVEAVAGLLSPTTGIIDSHAYMLSLQGDLEAAGGMVVFNTNVDRLELTIDGVTVHTAELILQTRLVINSAGLSAPVIASTCMSAPTPYYARGRYYTYSGRSPFKRLVYPLPEPGGLGVHVTLDLAGQARFGPDVAWIDSVDYTFDDTARDQFAAAIRRYYPALDMARMQPGYTGVRPKITGPGMPAADFRIDGPADHGIGGLVNLFGIESPGLTSSLAIADHVFNLVSAT